MKNRGEHIVTYVFVKPQKRLATTENIKNNFLIFKFSHSASSAIKPFIVNGEPATLGQFPFQVYVLLDKDRTSACGGSLIHPEWVLTAAHCVKYDNLMTRIITKNY
jgi:secreted trypsin-like serine protease